MGTTESILYDASLQQEQQRAHDIVDHSHSHGRRSSASGFASASASSTSSNVRRQRQRPRPGNVATLTGVVLGLTNSGKRTLLQRLEGKDPFMVDEHAEHVHVHAHDAIITVPYQPPPNATVWDRIQLQIQTTTPAGPCDFCVILVNPQHDPNTLRPYITNIVTDLVQQQQTVGYVKKTTPPRPLCLCILLNFRDLQGDQNDDCIQLLLADLEKWAKEILKQHSVLETKVVLQCGTTSLRNCYGLSSLHHFIYRSYLQHKQAEWEQRLEDVQMELDKSRDVPTMTFDAFLNVLEQSRETDNTLSEEKPNERNDETFDGAKASEKDSTRRKREERRNDRHVASEKETNQSLTKERKRVERQEKEQRRSILPNKFVDPTQTLDAFFADDDDDDGDMTPKTSHHARDNDNDDDDDDDDDDDFFYDEQGQRHQHGHVDSFSDDDDDEESHDSVSPESLAKARELSIVDEESSADEPPTSFNEKALQKTAQVVTNTCTVEATNTAHDENEMDMHNGDENGWGDDDIDLDDDDDDDDDYESKHGENERIHDQQFISPDTNEHTKKVEKDVNGSSNHEGWKDDDDDDLDLSDTDTSPKERLSPNDENSISVSDKVNTSKRAGDKDTLNQPKDTSTEETEQSGSAHDDEHSLVDSNALAADAISRSSHVEAVPDKEAHVTKPAHATTFLAKSSVDDDDDDESDGSDDDFIVEETLPKSLPKKSVDSKEPLIPREKKPWSVSSTAPSPSTPGISAAALAAIMAAEREAVLMVQEAMNAPPEKRAKRQKKKKDEAKKMKKKKKDLRAKDSD